MADKYNMTNAQMAVKWLIAQENVSILFKTKNPRHLADIMAVQNAHVDGCDLEILTTCFPRQEKTGFTTNSRAPLI